MSVRMGGLIVGAVAVVIVAVVLIAGSGGGGSSSAPDSGVAGPADASGGDSEAIEGTPAKRRARIARQAGRASVATVYDEMAAAVRAGVAPVAGDPQTGIERAADDRSLERICGLMSERAQRQTVRYARTNSGLGIDWTCEKAVAMTIRAARQNGSIARALRGKVVAVNVEGDHATATLDFGKGPGGAVSLVKEDGVWKLAGAPGS